jgi:glycine cleavage system H protein
MKFPDHFRYTDQHEWVSLSQGIATIGITEFAQSELGEVVFIDLPALGKSLKQKDSACVVESTKAASDVYSPVSGTVSEVNTSLQKDSGKINSDPHGAGWMLKLKVGAEAEKELAGLMDAAQYEKLLSGKLT